MRPIPRPLVSSLWQLFPRVCRDDIQCETPLHDLIYLLNVKSDWIARSATPWQGIPTASSSGLMCLCEIKSILFWVRLVVVRRRTREGSLRSIELALQSICVVAFFPFTVFLACSLSAKVDRGEVKRSTCDGSNGTSKLPSQRFLAKEKGKEWIGCLMLKVQSLGRCGDLSQKSLIVDKYSPRESAAIAPA